MNELIKKFSHVVKGVITGFDRIVFKGSILPLMYSEGVEDFCHGQGILIRTTRSGCKPKVRQLFRRPRGMPSIRGVRGLWFDEYPAANLFPYPIQMALNGRE